MSESSVNRGSQNMVYDVEREDGNVDVIGNDEKINNYSRHLIMLLCWYLLQSSSFNSHYTR